LPLSRTLERNCNADIKNAGKKVEKSAFFAPQNAYCFSACYTPIGEKKKYKAHISKYVPCILKYVRPIFRDVFEACPNMSA